MPRLRNRRGAMLVLGAVLFIGLTVMAVLAVDFSRVVAQRNEIHTASDAGALAGAIQFLDTPTTSDPIDTAVAYAQKNMIAGAPTPTAVTGFWNDSTRTFVTPSSEANAVRVQTQRSTNYLIGGLFNILPATMRRTSIAWANAPVGAAPCVRPWALPYERLLGKLGISDPNHVLTPGDLADLQALPITSRTDTIKFGDNDDKPWMPGNWNPIRLPSFWQASTGTYRAGGGGGADYRENIWTMECSDFLGVGDSVETEPGKKAGPSLQGADSLCVGMGGTMTGDTCYNSAGGVGIPIKIAYYGSERLQGLTPLKIRAIGGFVLQHIIHANGPDKSTIIGYYEVLTSSGTIGPGANTTLVRPILVQ